jgi:hypothetical protein
VSVEVRIDRLVLEGLPLTDTDGAVVAASLEAELGRLLGKTALGPQLQQSIAVPGVTGGSVKLVPGVGPAAVGRQIAGAVVSGVAP